MVDALALTRTSSIIFAPHHHVTILESALLSHSTARCDASSDANAVCELPRHGLSPLRGIYDQYLISSKAERNQDELITVAV